MNILLVACTWVVLLKPVPARQASPEQGLVILIALFAFLGSPVVLFFLVRGVLRWTGKQLRHGAVRGR